MDNSLAKEFDLLWQSSVLPPDVFDFLRGKSDLSASDRIAVLICDQERRWQLGRPLIVEDYLAHFSDLHAHADGKWRLVLGEYQARQKWSDPPALDEFKSRFPDIGDTLELEFTKYLVSGTVASQPDRFVTTTSYLAEPTGASARLGRYRLIKLLGQGGFGCVYLGFDEELLRQVAIKVPAPKRFKKPADAEQYLAEARTVARLDHPHIVPVHDVGRLDNGSIYVVSKFIPGRTLSEVLRTARPNHQESAKLLATVAQALHHAHSQRLVHRDVKPANILIEDATGVPYVTDFGLAIGEESPILESQIAGTPAYMSPEQARGEGHRLDGRSDIFSLGIVFYELLTGKRPFYGSTANELHHQVVAIDPLAPRELDPSIPAELERICLKALSKRASDRYSTAQALADDLVRWDQGAQQGQKNLRIIPKGLRSFDAGDADFFLELLPGPRDREGIPASIGFWKTRLEATDPDHTFSIGLIYGPSGCGKSSLVKAGLVPRLAADVLAIYVEAVPQETETRILRGLRKYVPNLPADGGLTETLAFWRRHGDRKVVLVLDQFEQWLHTDPGGAESELVRALRQCDGARLQAVLMVRDDFAMAAARFMDCVDVPIVQGHNFATIDFFDVEHAQKVVTKFGQAFHRLPMQTSGMSEDETTFVSRMAASLARDGKVVPVRLALFVEMVKGKPWVPATLDELGGTEGIGVSFLEEKFCSRSANPKHRQHEQAARDVLAALLPELGADIKGHMRSHQELLQASSYQSRPQAFFELLRILDGELRLITPTDPVGFSTDSGEDTATRSYQLTHDYLVTALRRWLSSKRRETFRGRAEIRLDERTRLWSARPEAKQLPSAWEWVNIRALTASQRWTAPQRAMMQSATKHHVAHLLLISAIVAAVLAVGGLWWRAAEKVARTQRVDRLVSDLWRTEFEHLPPLLTELEPYRPEWEFRVATVANDPAASAERRTRGYLALARRDGQHLDYLQQRMLDCEAPEQQVLREELRPWKPQLAAAIWAETHKTLTRDQLICAAAVLADYAPDHADWSSFAPATVDALIASDPLVVKGWVDAVFPVRAQMLAPLSEACNRAGASSETRSLAASILAHFANKDASLLTSESLIDLLLAADSTTYRLLEPLARQRRDSLLPLLRDAALSDVPFSAGEAVEKALARQANALESLFHMGEPDLFWSHLADEDDPRLRTLLIDRLSKVARDWRQLLEWLPDRTIGQVRQALLLGLAGYQREQLEKAGSDLTERLLVFYQRDPAAGVHSAAEWLLRTLRGEEAIASARQRVLADRASSFGWKLERSGLTMVRIDKPGTFQIGSPEDEPYRDSRYERQREVTLDYSYALSTCEVTLRQFQEFQAAFPFDAAVTPYPDCPVNKVNLYEAMKFCRWLSEREPDFDAANCCYPPIPEIKSGLRLPDDFCRRAGYRLPTIAEWEFAVRAGTRTSRFFGNSSEPINLYGWSAQNAQEATAPVGRLRPNPWGLFDVYGNVAEVCHELRPRVDATGNPIRGGDHRSTPRFLRSAMSSDVSAAGRSSTFGFRVAKFLPRVDNEQPPREANAPP